MLPLLLWCIVGGIVALLTTIRVQLVLLHADPTAGWRSLSLHYCFWSWAIMAPCTIRRIISRQPTRRLSGRLYARHCVWRSGWLR